MNSTLYIVSDSSNEDAFEVNHFGNSAETPHLQDETVVWLREATTDEIAAFVVATLTKNRREYLYDRNVQLYAELPHPQAEMVRKSSSAHTHLRDWVGDIVFATPAAEKSGMVDYFVVATVQFTNFGYDLPSPRIATEAEQIVNN